MKIDIKGVSPISAFLVVMLCSVAAFAAGDADNLMHGAFETRVLNKIYAIYPPDKDLFYLADERKGPVLFYGKGIPVSKEEMNALLSGKKGLVEDSGVDESITPLTCKQNVIFTIISELNEGEFPNEQGYLLVAVCDEHVALIKSFLKDAPAQTENMVMAFTSMSPREGPPNLKDWKKKFHWKKTLKDGSDLHYLTLILTTEGGVGVFPTAVLIRPDNHVIIVQALLNGGLCNPKNKSAGLPFCKTHPQNGLSKLVQSLAN